MRIKFSHYVLIIPISLVCFRSSINVFCDQGNVIATRLVLTAVMVNETKKGEYFCFGFV